MHLESAAWAVTWLALRRHTTLARLLTLPKGVKQKAEAVGVLDGAMRQLTSALCGLQATLDQLW